MINKMSAPDADCKEKSTCDCGMKFEQFFGIYLIIIVVFTVYRIKFYCRSVVRDVTRRELKDS